jgi:glycosyltransferase involved in cell wall biosynthesis
MRVLHVIQALGVGGAERVVVALARGSRRVGDEVAVASAGGDLAAELPDSTAQFPLPLLERRPSRLPAGVRSVDQALRAFRPDVVHAHNPGVALAAGTATLRGRRAPGYTSVHGVADEDYRAAARVLRLGGLPVIACGPAVAAGLGEQGLDVVATIPNGVPPAPAPADRAALERELGLRPGARLLVTVGRLTTGKNQALAVRALAAVPNATLVVAGDGPARHEVEAAARSAGVEDRVVLAGTRPDAWALVGAADAVVIPSRSEGMPLAALEALAAGRPLVATAVRGLRELLVDGRTAILVPPDDPDALAAGIRRVLDDAALARSLGELGLQEAARYTEDAMVEAYLRMYAEIVL